VEDRIKVINCLNQNIKTCIRKGNEYSEFSNCEIGVKQGENLSFFYGKREVSSDFRLHTSTTSLIGVSKCRFFKFMLLYQGPVVQLVVKLTIWLYLTIGLRFNHGLVNQGLKMSFSTSFNHLVK
jgi:hypothetical protein